MDISALLAEQTSFTTADIRRMHDAALRTLDQIGLAVDNPVALREACRRWCTDRRWARFSSPPLCRGAARPDPAQPRRGGPAVSEPNMRRSTARRHGCLFDRDGGDMCQYYHRPFHTADEPSIELDVDGGPDRGDEARHEHGRRGAWADTCRACRVTCRTNCRQSWSTASAPSSALASRSTR